jgi:hypothetical protein
VFVWGDGAVPGTISSSLCPKSGVWHNVTVDFGGVSVSLVTKVAIVVLTIAILIFAYGYFSYAGYDWTAATVAIDVGAEGAYELDFVSQVSAEYDLTLETERNLGFDEQNSRLGLCLQADRDARYPETLVIHWTVRQGSRTIASGRSNETPRGFWGRTMMGITLANFRTQKGKKYSVRAKILQIDPSLAITKPTLQVSLDSRARMSAGISVAIRVWVSFLFAGLAASIWLAGFAWRLWRGWRGRHLHERT